MTSIDHRPDGYYFVTRDWVEKANSKEDVQSLYRECFPEHIVHRIMPKGLHPDIHWKFSQETIRKIPASFIASVQEGRIWGLNGAIISPDNKLLADVSIEFNKPEQHSIFSQSEIKEPDYMDKTIGVAASAAGWNYYHWLFDILPRFYLLQKHGIEVDGYAINPIEKAFQQETLNRIGVHTDQLIQLNKQTHFCAAKLIIPSLPGDSGHMPKWVCDFLRREFLDPACLEPEKCKRIYISRKNAGYRKVANEIEVIEKLASFGFCPVVLENLSVMEQAQLFAAAKFVVAPHGAGLANLVFCQPGTKVIEIFSPFYVNVCYWALSNHMDLEYYYALGLGKQPPQYVDPHLVTNNILVDIAGLEKLLQRAEEI